jgi:serine/threonine-protein kinase
MVEFSCPQPDEWQRFLLGKTPEPDAEQLERHLSGCPACQEATQALESSDPLLASVCRAIRKGEGLSLAVNEELIDQLCQLQPATNLSTVSSPPGTVPAAGPDDMADIADLFTPPEEPDELGRIGPYGILRVLGRGGMGIVFLAREQRPRRVVALKMLDAGSRGGRRGLERFRAESETLARLPHPNIVRVLAVGEHAGRPFFTTEYAEGGSLAQKLAVAPLPERAAAELTRTLAATVHAAHGQGIIHRDLKPSNVLLSAHGTPLIADFGLAKVLTPADPSTPFAGEPAQQETARQTRADAILGTPAYMAPEQAAGHSKEIGPAADVYALGAILYECLTGRPPFKAASLLETLEQVRSQEPVPPARLLPRLARDLQTICLKCLEKNPGRRYATARDLADDLDHFLAGRPIVARPVRAWERAWKWARRQPAAAALVAVSAAAVLAAVIGVVIHQAQLRQAAAQAQHERQVADERYQAARDTLAQILNELNNPRVAEVPGLHELRRQTLEHALAFYTKVQQESAPLDPVIQRDTAFIYADTALAQIVLAGQGDRAREHFERAVKLFDALPAGDRASPECRHKRAQCVGYLGLLSLRAGGNRAEGEERLRAANAALEQVVREQPGNGAWKDDLAWSEHQLGVFCRQWRQLPEALKHWQRAVALRTEVVRAHPQVDRYKLRLAETCINLSVLAGEMKIKEDPPALPRAIDLLRPLVERHPEILNYKTALGSAYVNAGQALRSDGKPREALKLLDQAVELAEAGLRQEPTHVETRLFAFNAHGARAQVHESQKDWRAAVRDWDRVVALDAQPNAWLRRLFRANALARAGEHARAADEALALAKQSEVPAEGRYNLACALALAVSAARADGKLPAEQRSTLAERYAGQAMRLLGQLAEQGYFRDGNRARLLDDDKDLKALRDRDDFRRLLKKHQTEK